MDSAQFDLATSRTRFPYCGIPRLTYRMADGRPLPVLMVDFVLSGR